MRREPTPTTAPGPAQTLPGPTQSVPGLTQTVPRPARADASAGVTAVAHPNIALVM
jgi:hypothetical protein